MEQLIEQLKQAIPKIEGRCSSTQLELSRAIGFLGRAIKESQREGCRSHDVLSADLQAMCEWLELWKQTISAEQIH